MQFIDESVIKLISGKGGDGICSFRREKFIPLGGPDGGDGGEGGNIYIAAQRNILSLCHLKNRKNYIAGNGAPGSNNNKTGSNGKNILVYVPLGTKVFDFKTKEFILEVKSYGKKYILLKGGSNGCGNLRFKSSTNRSPKKVTKGKTGEKKYIKLELNTIASICMLGLPNAGKSSLVSNISNIRIKKDYYPFSTECIYIGICTENHSTIMDTPSINKDIILKKGSTFRFLKHTLKSKTIFYILDISYNSLKEILNSIYLIEYQLHLFNKKFFFKKVHLVFNKSDKMDAGYFSNFIKYLLICINKKKYDGIFFVSSKQSKGLSFVKRSSHSLF